MHVAVQSFTQTYTGWRVLRGTGMNIVLSQKVELIHHLRRLEGRRAGSETWHREMLKVIGREIFGRGYDMGQYFRVCVRSLLIELVETGNDPLEERLYAIFAREVGDESVVMSVARLPPVRQSLTCCSAPCTRRECLARP